MTNGHSFDLEVQDQILRGGFCLRGRHRLPVEDHRCQPKLRERGVSEEAIGRVHTPIGTPISRDS